MNLTNRIVTKPGTSRQTIRSSAHTSTCHLTVSVTKKMRRNNESDVVYEWWIQIVSIILNKLTMTIVEVFHS